MSLTAFTIGGTEVQAYASIAEAEAILFSEVALYPAWSRLDEAAQARFLVSATGQIDNRPLAGEGQRAKGRHFPLEGETEVPQPIETATALLAGLLATAPPTASPTASPKRVKAGPAEIEYFAPPSGVSSLQSRIDSLLAPFLLTTETSPASVGIGTSDLSTFRDNRDL